MSTPFNTKLRNLSMLTLAAWVL